VQKSRSQNIDVFERRTVCIWKDRVIAGKSWRGKTLLFALQAIKHKGRMNIFMRIKLIVLIVKKLELPPFHSVLIRARYKGISEYERSKELKTRDLAQKVIKICLLANCCK